MKEFFLAVIAGVVAIAIYRTKDAQPVTTNVAQPVLGDRCGAWDERYGINVYTPIPIQAGHGDATSNATGASSGATVGTTYAPAFGPAENQPNRVWMGPWFS